MEGCEHAKELEKGVSQGGADPRQQPAILPQQKGLPQGRSLRKLQKRCGTTNPECLKRSAKKGPEPTLCTGPATEPLATHPRDGSRCARREGGSDFVPGEGAEEGWDGASADAGAAPSVVLGVGEARAASETSGNAAQNFCRRSRGFAGKWGH